MSAARKDPGQEENWDHLEDVCRELDRPEEAAALFAEVVDSDQSPELRVQLGLRAAGFCEEWFEETEPVVAMLSRVLRIDPTQREAFERLTVLLTVSSRWSDLLSAYDSALGAAESDEEKAHLLEEAAKVARDFAGNSQLGSDYLKQLLLLRLRDDQLAAILEKRLDEQGRHQDLVDIWSARLSVLDGSSGKAVRLQIAARQLDALKEADAALATIDSYLEVGGPPEDALQLLARTAASEAAGVPVRRAALGKLARLEQDRENWPQVVDALEHELSLIEIGPESTALHRRVATILHYIARDDEALGHATAVMRQQPDDGELRELARKLAVQVNREADYVEALKAAAEVADPDDDSETGGLLRVDLLLEAAELSEVQLGAPHQAIQLYARLVDDPAATPIVRLHACRRLCVLLEAQGEMEHLLDYRVRRADLETEADQRREVLGQAARLADDLGRVDQALGLWDARLGDDSTDLEALGAKIDLLRRSDRSAGLVEALEARAKVCPEPEQCREDLVFAAEIYDSRLSNVAQAIERWQEVEERFGRVEQTVDHLVDLFCRASRYEEVAALLAASVAAAEAEGAPATERVVAHLALMGDILGRFLERPDAAIAAYARAVAYSPTDETSRTGLRSFLENDEHAHAAAEELVKALRVVGEPEEIIALAEVRLRVAPDRAFQADILCEVARLEEASGRLDAAAHALARAFALVPNEETELALVRVADLASVWEIAADGYVAAALACTDEARLVSLHRAHGRIAEERLGDFARATTAFSQALQADPSDLATAKALSRVGLGAGLYREAAEALLKNTAANAALSLDLCEYFRGRADLTGSWEEVLGGLADGIATQADLSVQLLHDLKVQLAIWYRDCASDADSAELVLRRAVQDLPQEDSLRMLAELQRRTPGRALIDTLLKLAEVTGGELLALREAGEVALASGDDLAEKILEQSLALASARFKEEYPDGRDTELDSTPSEAEAVVGWALDGLVQLALKAGLPDWALGLLAEAATLPWTPVDLVAWRYQAAAVAADGGLDSRAVELGEALLSDVPDHGPTITLLSRLHEAAGRLEQLLDLRQRELALGPDADRRLFLRLDQARVMGELGASVDERLEVLRENLSQQPGEARSIDAIEALLRQAERFEEAAELLETQALVVVRSDRSRASAMWLNAGRIAEEQLADLPRLEADFRAAVAAEPDPAALDRLAELARAAGLRTTEVSWLEQRLALAPPASESEEAREERRRIVRQYGEALVAAEEFAHAKELLESELRKDPGADASRRILMELYASFEEWADLSELLAAGVDYAPDDEARIDYLRRAALVERRRLGQVGRAVELLEQAVALAPKDRELRVLLADCLLEHGVLERGRDILVELLGEFGRRRTKERASVHKLLARIARADGHFDEALAQAEEAAKIERMDPGILMLLAGLARERGEIDRAEQAYRTLALVVSRRKSAPSEEEEQFGEAAILFELYQIASARGNEGQARELLSSALEVATRSNEEALELEKSLRAVGQADLLLSAIDQQLEVAEGAAAAGLLVTRAVILEKNGEVDAALSARLSALQLQPTSARIIDGARKLADRIGALHAWLTCLMDLAERHGDNPETAGELWHRLGRAAEEQNDLYQAAAYFERAQTTGYRPRRAFLALDAVLSKLGDRARSQNALSRFVGTPGAGSAGETMADALYRLAGYELGDGRVAEGADHLSAATALRADDERTLSLVEPVIRAQVATPGLVRMFLDVATAAGEDDTKLLAYLEAAKLPDVEPETLAAGIRLARETSAGQELRILLSRRIALAQAADELEAVQEELLERADLAELDRDATLAVALIERVVPLLDGEEGLGQRLRLAGILAGQLGDLEAAKPIYETLLEERPADRRIWQPLLELYRRQGDSEAVERCMLLVEPQVEDRADREVLRMARIRLMVGAGRLEEAESALRMTLEDEPDSEEAAQVLVELLRKAERFDELRSLLEELFDKARERADAPQVAKYGLEVARAFGERREEAVAILTSGLTLAHGNAEYLKTLLALQGPEANPDDRGSVLGHLIEVAPPPEAENYAFQLIALRENQGDDVGVGRALELGQAAVPDSASLSDRLVEYLRRHEDYSALADLLLNRARSRTRVDVALEEFTEAAYLFEQNLGEPARAAEAMLAAFARKPDEVAFLRRGAEYLVQAGEVDHALEKLGKLIEMGDELILADLLDQRAKILETERPDDLESLEQASVDLRAALQQLLPEEQEANLQLRRGNVLETLRSIYAERGETEREREVMLELAAQRVERGEFQAAVSTLASWITEHPDDLVVARQLGDTASRAGDAMAALLAYQSLYEASSGVERREAVLNLSVMAERAGDPMRAREQLEEVFRELPGDDGVRRRLRAMYESAGAYRELADLLMGEAATIEEPGQRFALLVEIGELCLKAGDVEGACDMFESARQLQPDSYLIVTKLAQAYVDQGEVDRAEQALDAALEQHGRRRTPDLALLQHGLALVAEARGDIDGMFNWLEAALMSDRANGDIATELAVRAQDSGRYDVAVKALQVIALGKGTDGMSKGEAYYRQAQIAAEQGDSKKALMLARRATTSDVDYPPAHDLVNQLS